VSPTVDFYFDYASPWSYLADSILDRTLPGVSVNYRPIYIRGLPAFSKGLPYDMTRLQYIAKDFVRCTAFWGVHQQFPSDFPINGIYALRISLWTQVHAPDRFLECHRALFQAAWRDDREIANKQVAVDVAAGRGLDAAALSSGIDEAAIKDALREQTSRAMERGVFGVPSFFLGDELYFGHDRLDYLRRAVEAQTAR
jgi:2-hydroxychromene-2-carboxylate isomerase